MRELLIGTKNKGKVPEMTRPLEGLPFELISLLDVPEVADVEETGTTYIENATLKATTYGKQTGLLTVADDSGLEIDAFDGKPGVLTARFLQGSYQERMQSLLEMLKDVPEEKRGATFRSVVVVYDPETNKTHECEGIVKGSITREVRGEHGFGYDPVFEYSGQGKTGAELGLTWKFELSHRALAMRRLREVLLKEFV